MSHRRSIPAAIKQYWQFKRLLVTPATQATQANKASGVPLPPKLRITWGGGSRRSSLLRRVLTGTVLGSMIAAGAYVGTLDKASISAWSFEASRYINPPFRLLDPEDAHRIAIWAASHGLVPQETRPDPPILAVEVWGRKLSNPVGLGAGFDKNVEAVDGLLGMGFGFVEVGTVTPLPQEGNPKPRIFRLPEQKAVINRCGFNNDGIIAVAKRLSALHEKHRLAGTTSMTAPNIGGEKKSDGKVEPGLVGVNLGKNKTTEDAAADYVQGVHTLSQYADYLVINVSSPNTPGLRKLQGKKQLKDLITKVLAARDEMQWGKEGPPPLLVKISPDLSKQDLADIAAVSLTLCIDGLDCSSGACERNWSAHALVHTKRRNRLSTSQIERLIYCRENMRIMHKFENLTGPMQIISNTTIARPDSVLGAVHADEIGGLSGKPLFKLSTDALCEMYRLTRGKIPLIGCGGISSGEDAYMKIRAGATLVQIYTGFAYEGPSVVPQIKEKLAACLERDGFKSVHEAVGVDCR